MGVDHRNVIMYGKEFDSFRDAMEHLVRSGKITYQQHDEALDDGEPDCCEWHVYNAYSGGSGVLGESFTARTLYTDPDCIKTVSEEMDKLIGEGCEIHEFVKVY